MNLQELEVIDLLRFQAEAVKELRRRGVVRTNNSPLGDYAEWIVSRQLGLTLVENSKAGFDAVSDAGVTYQIKSRRVTATNNSRLLSAIRNYDKCDFDWLVAIIFNERFSVLNAYIMPHEVVGQYSPHRDHVNGRIVNMSGPILADGRVMEITEQFE